MNYKEEQSINSLFLKIIVPAIFIGITVSFIFSLREMIKDGDVPYYQILLLFFLNIGIISLVSYLIFFTKLETDISNEGFGYRYFPVLPKRKLIKFDDVKSWQIKKSKMFGEMGGYGYRKAVFSKKSGYIMHNNYQLEFLLNSGYIKIFSVENKDNVSDILRRYMQDKEKK